MLSIVFEDNSNSLRYWIDIFILAVWIREDFIARWLFADSLFPVVLFFSFFLLHITQAPCAFFPLFFHVPSQVSNLSHSSSLPVLLLHQYNGRFSWELPLKKTFFYFSLNDPWITPRKIVFILLDSLTFQKIYVTIYLFICLMHASRCTKTRTGLFNQLGPWWVSFLFGSVDKLTRCNNGRPPVSAKLTPFLTL